MASGQTTNYGLNQWVAEDKVMRTEFNTDNIKLDVALGEIAASLVKVVTGVYSGNGTASRVISLGFTPKAVYVCHRSGKLYNGNGNYYYGGLALTDHSVRTDGGYEVVKIVSGGFQVAYNISDTQNRVMSNANSSVYHYAALQ